ncbi:MAG: 2,4-diaminopentanoate dehydrogenase [Clostridia bacterium]
MTQQNIKVAIWGFGAMGSGICKTLLGKKGVDIVGVCDIHPLRVGKSIFEMLKVERGDRADVLVQSDISKVVFNKNCDIAVLATDSYTAKAFDKIKYIVEQGVNVISTAEEMSYPKAQQPKLAQKIDLLAKEHNVSVLGTGINPGLIMDLLVVCLTGCMTDVTGIEAKRVNSLSPFGPAVMEEQGVGISVKEFEDGVTSGKLAGHVGFAESVNMIADALSWKIDKFTQQMKPIVTTVDRKSPYGKADAGDVAGVNMTGQAYVDGEVKINMIHPQQIEPEMEGTFTGDYITLAGNPPVSMSIKPEVNGGIGTIAMVVNMIPACINADSGLVTMIDLPVPRAIMGDYRNAVKDYKRIIK